MNQLKALFFFVLSICSLHTAAQRIKGSDTVLPVSQETAEIFMNTHPEQRVTITGGGTGVGISALMDHTTDIAMASRPIKFSEKMKLKAAGQEVKEVIIAYDALAIIVHPDNPVSRLTRQQLEGIFRGKIVNWKQGRPRYENHCLFSRNLFGTYEFFKESVLKNKNYMSGSLSMPATGAVIQSVSQTKGAIGYVGLAYLSDRVKPIAVSYDEGKHYVLPTMENGTKRQYPVVRPLYYYYNVSDKAKVSPFIEYVLSPAGQNIIKKGGYIPVK